MNASDELAEIPASDEQSRLWVQMTISGGASQFHIPHVLEVSGALDHQAFTVAVQDVVARHEALRSAFAERSGSLYQVIHPSVEIPVTVHRHTEQASDALIAKCIADEVAAPFDLTNGPLLRVSLHRLGEARHVVALTVHHLVADGWSLDLMLSQLWARYEDRRQGRQAGLTDAKPLQYADYALWQQQGGATESFEQSLDYWSDKLHAAPTLNLPFALARPRVQTHRGELHFFTIMAAVRDQAQALARRQGTTLFTVVLAAWRCLLADYAGQDDFCIGTTASNRMRPGSEEIVGFFANLLALRTSRAGCASFADLLVKEHQTALDALMHQEVSFDRVVARVDPERDYSRSPLFQVNVVLQNTKEATGHAQAAALSSSALTVVRRDDLYRYAQYDITLFAEQVEDGMHCCLVFNTDVFQQADIERMGQAYAHYLEVLAASPNLPFQQIDRLPAQLHRLLDDWQHNDPQCLLPGSIGAVVDQLARLQPKHPAVRCGDLQLDFAEFNREANRLAWQFRALGIAPGSTIGICLDPGIDAIVTMLAVLNAGCAYVPLDSRYPSERLQYLIKDSGVSVIVTSEVMLDHVAALQDSFLNLLVLDEQREDIAGQPDRLPDGDLPPQAAAYVMYTSGTTDRPKGVVVPQQAILRLAYRPDFIDVSTDDVFLQFAPAAFDASTFEIWTALLNGAALVVPGEPETPLDQLGALIEEQGITVLWLTSGLFSIMVDHAPASLHRLRYLVCGGDVLSAPHVARASALLAHGTVVNGYGPTETTTFATTYAVPAEYAGTAVPIGSPIKGTSVYVCDDQLNLLPPGAAGDMYIGGRGLAHGYINRPELTAAVFLPDPFSAEAGARMYRSGDIGMWRHDGRLCYLGRCDRQLKLRGFRIEPAEIEAALLQCKGVAAAAAVADVSAQGDKQLVVYWSAHQGADGGTAAADETELRRHLKNTLPDYMLPSRYCQVSAIPLTANGKVDRSALPNLVALPVDRPEVTSELTALQRRLYRLWEDVLGRTGFTIDQGFFDLGGDSLLAIKLKAKAQEQNIDFDIQDLFSCQSIAALSAWIEQRQPSPLPTEEREISEAALLSETDAARLPAGVIDAYPLSQLQLGMLYHSYRHGHSSLYHDVIGYTVAYPCHEAHLTQSLARLTARHPALRTSLDMETFETPLQLVHEQSSIPLTVVDIAALSAEQQTENIAGFMDQERFARFDLAQAPLFRCFVFRLDSTRFKLIWSFHHAMLDGWSEAALTTEFLHLYVGALSATTWQDEPIHTCYRDFIKLERAALASDAHRAFWREMLADAKPTSLRRKPANTSGAGADEQIGYFPVPISATLEASLRALAREANVSLKSVLLTAHLHALSGLTGSNDVLVSTVMHVRPETEDADKVIGLFLNSVPLRAACDLAAPAIDQVRAVFDTESRIFQHRFYPSQQIRQDAGGLELGEVLFNFTSYHILRQLEQADRDMLHSRDGHAVNNFPIQVDFSVAADSGKLACIISYRTDAFEREDIEEIAHAQQQALLKLADQSHRPGWLLPASEAALTAWGTPRCPVTDESFGERLLAKARHQPHAVAIIDGDVQIDYAQLAERCDCLAAALAGLGVEKGDTVALCAERSASALLTVLALFRLGAVYMPLDAHLPRNRIDYMLADAQPRLIIGDRHAPAFLMQQAIRFVGTLELEALGDGAQCAAPAVFSSDPAYILYTSGSTGQPKGVLCRQDGILALFQDLQQHYTLSSDDRVLWKTAVSFDVSLTEMLWPFLAGAAVVIARPDGQYDPHYLARLIVERHVTVLNFVPSMLHLFLQENRFDATCPIKAIFVVGEVLLPATAELTGQVLPQAVLFNAYGPTEASIYATIWRCHGDNVLIGKAVGDIGVHILAPDLSRLPIGAVGELYLSGCALATGYLNQAQLTAERFLPNPYATGADRWLYRTGDLARFDRNGDIAFVGRCDQQVKLRGFRIEPGEIESVLGRHPAVAKVAVMVRAHGAQAAILCAFVEKTGQGALGIDELKAHAENDLPGYMIPDVIVVLEALPMTVSGKIDRNCLLVWDIDVSKPRPDHVELNACEAAIAAIWRNVLGIQDIDPDANFFDVGGHSLAMIQCQSQLRSHFGREVEIDQLFRHTSVRALAKWLSAPAPSIPVPERPVLAQATETHRHDVAIVGMSASVSGAGDVEQYWSMLLEGRDGITRYDNATLRQMGVPEALIGNSRFVAAKGAMANPDCFDAGFFGYTPREAEIMDPQQRKLLEQCYLALENAGYADPGPDVDVGVYVGTGASSYLLNHVLSNEEAVETLGHYQINVLNQPATQIAYRLNLTGPAITLNTACSTSLVAMHMASRAILNGECHMALAGAASIGIDATPGYLHRTGGIFSTDGYCRAFDAAASGTIEGSGVGVVLLKRYDLALRDGDHVVAIIKGSAINNDGHGKVGYTAPSPEGQARVIRSALAEAKVPAASIAYVETHGTGTVLGDPIEVAALKSTYGQRPPDTSCLLGAVKTTIGHLDSAAGVAGAIKAALVLNRRQLPGTLHFQSPHPLLGLDDTPFILNPSTIDLSGISAPLRAAVSSFGIGGTNAHMILEAVDAPSSPPSAQRFHCLRLSARTPQALQTAVADLAAALQRNPGFDLADVAYSLQTGRRDFSCRAYLIADTVAEAVDRLAAGEVIRKDTRQDNNRHLPVIFLFTGQGGQKPGMGHALYRDNPAFRQSLDQVCALFDRELGCSLQSLMFDETSVAETQPTSIVQPLLFAYQYALVQAWTALGVTPDYLIGHSLGELVAACCAGVFSLGDAVKLVTQRARVMQAQPEGAMLAVSMAEDELLTQLPADVSLAAVNAPLQCVVSGPVDAIERLARQLRTDGIAHTRLASSHAFHSPAMRAAAEQLAANWATVTLAPPTIPFVSNLTGKLITAEQAVDPAYWAEHMVQAVRFSDGVRELAGKGEAVWMEIGPRDLLAALVRTHRLCPAESVLASFPERSQEDARSLIDSYGRLWSRGARLQCRHAYRDETRQRLPLPGYPFEQTRYWLPARALATVSSIVNAPEKTVVASAAVATEATKTAKARPLSMVELTLTNIWKECLGYEQIAPTDDFFALGGDSLLAGRIITRIQERLQVDLPLITFFNHSTIAGLATVLNQPARAAAAPDDVPSLPQAQPRRLAPLSFQQGRLWTLERLGMGGRVFHLPQCIHLRGQVDRRAIAAALAELVKRHPTLRTSFHVGTGQTDHQCVHAAVDVDMDTLSFPGGSSEEEQAFLQNVMAQQLALPFQLDRAPLFHAMLIDVSPHHVCLSMVFHHLVVDGWSFKLIARELAALYAEIGAGQLPVTIQPEWDYADYSVEQTSDYAAGRFAAQQAFWRQQLQNLPVVDLPTDRPRDNNLSATGREHRFDFDADQSAAVEKLCRRLHATPYVVFLSAFLLMLSRHIGQHDLVVGSPVANRSSRKVEDLVGFFVNMLVLRIDFSAAGSLRQWIEQVRASVLAAQSNQDYPFEKLVEQHAGPRNASLTPLFQVVFSMQEEPTHDFALGDVEISFQEVREVEAEYELTLNLFRRGAAFSGVLQYRAGLFEDDTTEQMMEQFRYAVMLMTAQTEMPLHDVCLLPEARRHQVLAEWNPQPSSPPLAQDVLELLSAAMTADNEAIAILTDSEAISYRELAQRMDNAARVLAGQGAGAGERVAVCLESGIGALVAILGILRCGASYLPLDPAAPVSRQHAILAQAAPSLLVVGDASTLSWDRCPHLHIDRLLAVGGMSSMAALPQRPAPESIAYTLFTSGSTGVPKGVEVSHRALAHKIQALHQTYRMEQTDRVLHFSSLVFDVSLEEIFTTLHAAACLLIGDKSAWPTMGAFSRYLEASRATVVNLPASFWREWLREIRLGEAHLPGALRLVVTGSEKVHPSSLQDWRAVAGEQVGLINAYGLTETVVTSIAHRCEHSEVADDRDVPIGRPLPYSRAYVLDAFLQPVAPAGRGQLYIGGSSALASGYLGHPDLTAESFIPDPFCAEPGARMYRTGDMVRRTRGGDIIYLGRKDRQVKLRGIRIELAEVEHVLLGLTSVREAAVRLAATSEDSPQEARIEAFVVLEPGSPVTDARGLLRALRRTAPSHLVPHALAVLPTLPKTVGDKIDYRQIPQMRESRDIDDNALASPALQALLSVLRTVLHLPHVDIEDNYFGLGGDSILVLRAISQLNRRGWTIDPPDFFFSPTIADLADCLKPLKNPFEAGVTQDSAASFPLTSYQRRQLQRKTATHWNRSLLIQASVSLQAEALHSALRALLKAHTGLRCVFDGDGDGATGRILPFDERMLASIFSSHDLRDVDHPETVVLTHSTALQRSFDLKNGPLIRLAHFRYPDGADRLFIVIHGLVADSHAWSVLLDDLTREYQRHQRHQQGMPTAELHLDTAYPVYLQQLAHRLADSVQTGEVAAYFATMADNVAIPRDRDGDNIECSQQAILHVLDPSSAGLLLLAMPSRHRIKAATVAVAAAARALCDWAQGPLVVDIGRHGRDWLAEPAVGRTVGCFVCDVPAYLPADVAYRRLPVLQEFERTLDHLPLASLGWDRLPTPIDGIAPNAWQRIARPEVSIDFVSAPAAHASSPFSLAVEAVGADRAALGQRSHCLNLIAMVQGGEVTLECRYSEALHDRSVIDTIMQAWQKHLSAILLLATEDATSRMHHDHE